MEVVDTEAGMEVVDTEAGTEAMAVVVITEGTEDMVAVITEVGIMVGMDMVDMDMDIMDADMADGGMAGMAVIGAVTLIIPDMQILMITTAIRYIIPIQVTTILIPLLLTTIIKRILIFTTITIQAPTLTLAIPIIIIVCLSSG